MRINVIEKFGLYEKLADLSKGLNEHEESQTICNKAIHDLKSGFTTNKFNLYVEQLKQYDWITEVEAFLESVETFVNDNKYGLALESIMNKLDGVATYTPVVETIQSLVVLDESEIKKGLPSLAAFKYEPNVRRLVEAFEQAEFNVQVNEKARITSAPISPVMELEEGFVFATNSGNYHVSSDLSSVEKYTGKVTNEFAKAKEALSMFTYKGENTFEANLPKANIQIVAGEEGTSMKINESVIDNKPQLTNILKNAGFVNYTDTKTRAVVEFMYEKASELVEIDFVKAVETINENFEIFKMANNEISIAKFDKKTRGYVLESLDLEDVEELSESLNKKYDLDFNNILEGLHINVGSLEFKALVESIDTSKIVDMTVTDEIYAAIDEATTKYNDLGETNQKNVEAEYKTLVEMESTLKSEEVIFLVETKKALVEKLDEGEELTKSIEMLNEELTTLIVEKKKLSKEDAIAKAIEMGVDFDKDFHAQSFGNELAELAKECGFKKSKSASGSLGRAFFEHLEKIYDKSK
jgi:hypothetical protein